MRLLVIEAGLPKPCLNGIMRSKIAACAILVLMIGTVDAEACPPGALWAAAHSWWIPRSIPV
jgi:hypothetical protein